MKTPPNNECTNCGNKLDAATGLENEQAVPSEGDISVCAYCGQLGVYYGDAKIRKMREDEIHKLYVEHPDVANTIRQIQSVFAFVSQRKTPSDN